MPCKPNSLHLLMADLDHEATKSAPTNCICFEIPKPRKPTKGSFCAAAIGLKVGFLICKWTLGMISMKDHFWPNLAVWNGMIEGRSDWPRVDPGAVETVPPILGLAPPGRSS